MKSDAWHHRADALTSIGAFIGISVALIGGQGYEAADDWAALVASAVIDINAIRLLRPAIADLMDRAPDDPQVQQQIARHHAWIERFYPAPAEVYRGLGRLYVEHEEFRAFYEKYRPGLASFMQAAMAYYPEHTLDG